MSADCDATMVAFHDPEHTHRCSGQHDAMDHFCAECHRWFYEAPKKPSKASYSREG